MPYTKKFADIYEKWVNKSPKEIRNWLRAEIEYLKKNLKRNSRVLDVGCGYGRIIKAITKYHKEVWGIDNSKIQLAKARKNLKKFNNVHLELEDAKKMNFPDGYFDYVVCTTNTFGNFGKDKLKILREMKRVIQKRGKIIVSVYHNTKKVFDLRIRSYEKANFPISKIDYNKRLAYLDEIKVRTEQFSKKQLRDIFKKAELRVKVKPLTKIGYICEAIAN